MSEEPYFVEVDRVGCSSCGKGTTWTVIGPQGAQHSESWGSEGEAANFAECMNEAYANGRAASLSPKIPAPELESRSIEIAELRGAIEELQTITHPVTSASLCHGWGFDRSCMYCQRLEILRARLAELAMKAEEKP